MPSKVGKFVSHGLVDADLDHDLGVGHVLVVHAVAECEQQGTHLVA